MNSFSFSSIAYTFCLLIFISCNSNSPSEKMKYIEPTEIYADQNEKDLKNKREQWYEQIHWAPEGLDWRAIEYKNQWNKHQKKKELRKSRTDCGIIEEIVPNGLRGTWYEKGSINQAGSVFDTDYDPLEDMIYVISAGGTLFKGPRSGNEWEVINQDFQFDTGLLKAFNDGNGNVRIIASIGKNPHYSDDGGLSWEKSEGIDNQTNGQITDVYVIQDSLQRLLFLSSKHPGIGYQLMESIDQGKSFQELMSFSNADANRISINKPHNSQDLYIIERKSGPNSHMYQWNFEQMQLDTLSHMDNMLFSLRSDLDGILYNDSIVRFYAYDASNVLYMTEDFGANWENRGAFPRNPWSVGLHISPQFPDVVYIGEVNCHRSIDAGQSWLPINEWWEYYDDVEGKLHADIMHFASFTSNDGEPFTLISNHGGLSISYDEMVTTTNLSLEGLNVSQYYSVRSKPGEPELVWGGTQDQGLQKGFSFFEDEQIYFDQVISGDYGHIVFTSNGNNMWTTYPFGSISLWANNSNYTTGYTIESNNELPWIQYMVASPNQEEDVIYTAGGSADGGSGSFMIKLDYQVPNLTATNLPFNFLSDSGSLLSALGISSLSDGTFYAVTENGHFYRSEDQGQTWTKSNQFLPSGSWLYGQAMLVSKQNEGTVWIGGSGYGGSSVYRTVDGAESFQAVGEGLPQTLVYDLAANEDESLIFAATENGPYVYVESEEKWFDLSALCAPANTYWSVEYIPELNTARFGTYGRGIWDFVIEKTSVGTDNQEERKAEAYVYPNPASDLLKINIPASNNEAFQVNIFTIDGKRILSKKDLSQDALTNGINISHFQNGAYFITLNQNDNLVEKLYFLKQ